MQAAKAKASDSVLALVNGRLISAHYLTTQLPRRDDWATLLDDVRAAQIEKVYEKAKPRLSKNKPSSKGSNEASGPSFFDPDTTFGLVSRPQCSLQDGVLLHCLPRGARGREARGRSHPLDRC